MLLCPSYRPISDFETWFPFLTIFLLLFSFPEGEKIIMQNIKAAAILEQSCSIEKNIAVKPVE
jgi:hypothetical protein